ncbi:hypothetical protein MIZ03_0903 [Rhodoferax lithotrophicus]|uniref:Uncharacterized protein n=1 Tax=Rhodoferax lithotrophicus TaxID=2798804 RepID=A0ABM7MIF0_9BURK|nr:hypothetical protein [Rhodoferax sp. MIZ03]BCO26023.1 hypothetical protein MIZ03_0903 [Rhodoferax sp. MIZ03]
MTKKLQKCRIGGACPERLFPNFPTRIGHFDDARMGFDRAVELLINKDFL